ncbi:hypothetical protein AMJ57_01020 [Parcubacteria bacterium SG8_24]|nr:MAG: hypothetical protein AMJ57_01020 [Parcubacteria bacterium SG8_24]
MTRALDHHQRRAESLGMGPGMFRRHDFITVPVDDDRFADLPPDKVIPEGFGEEFPRLLVIRYPTRAGSQNRSGDRAVSLPSLEKTKDGDEPQAVPDQIELIRSVHGHDTVQLP